MTGVIFSVTISMEKNAKICHARLGALVVNTIICRYRYRLVMSYYKLGLTTPVHFIRSLFNNLILTLSLRTRSRGALEASINFKCYEA